MKECAKKCMETGIKCPYRSCRKHIDYPDDLNCCLVAIQKNPKDEMSLREVAQRMQLSYVRIKQIEDEALRKLNIARAFK